MIAVDRDSVALTLTIVAEFDTPAERVWQMWADPRQVERWWGPPTHPATVVDQDLTDGGRVTYYMTGPDGEKLHGWWRIISDDPPRSLEFEDGCGPPNDELPTTSVEVGREDHRRDVGHDEALHQDRDPLRGLTQPASSPIRHRAGTGVRAQTALNGREQIADAGDVEEGVVLAGKRRRFPVLVHGQGPDCHSRSVGPTQPAQPPVRLRQIVDDISRQAPAAGGWSGCRKHETPEERGGSRPAG